MTNIEAIAETVHEAVRAWARANGQDAIPAWSDAADWMKASSRESAKFVLAHPGAGASAQHDQWMAQRLSAGWTYGEMRDEALKTHPMLVAYSELPQFEKKKDELVRAIVAVLGA